MPLKNPLYLLSFLLITSCDQRSPRQRLVDYMNDPANKIRQIIRIGDVKVTSKLLPYNYSNKEDAISKDGYVYFSVNIESHKNEKPSKEKVLYLDFDMQQDFTLLRGTDSVAPVICQKIQNGRPGSYEYVVAFNDDHNDQDYTLFYKDKLFGIGTVAFVYDQQHISNIPVLKTLDTNETHL